MKPSTFLKNALRVIEKPENWIKGILSNVEMTAFCSIGAIDKAYFDLSPDNSKTIPLYMDSRNFLKEAIGGGNDPSIVSFNDAGGRTHSEIVDLFLNAIRLAKAAGK